MILPLAPFLWLGSIFGNNLKLSKIENQISWCTRLILIFWPTLSILFVTSSWTAKHFLVLFCQCLFVRLSAALQVLTTFGINKNISSHQALWEPRVYPPPGWRELMLADEGVPASWSMFMTHWGGISTSLHISPDIPCCWDETVFMVPQQHQSRKCIT